MTERPIIFSTPMVQAIRAGRKSQTRRVVKPQPVVLNGVVWWWNGQSAWPINGNPESPCIGCPPVANFCPYGQVGDRLWVREQVRLCADPLRTRPVWYVADGPCPDPDAWPLSRSAIHMPRWASRIILEVTGIRMERVQDICEEDAIAEGLQRFSKDQGRTWKYGIPDRDGLPGQDDHGWPWAQWDVDPRKAYHRLWDSINGKKPGRSWADNPWVWVVEFKEVPSCA